MLRARKLLYSNLSITISVFPASSIRALQPSTTQRRSYQTMSAPASKKQRTLPQFELLYWPGIPGRGEFVRLPLEASGTPYSDICNEKKDGINELMKLLDTQSESQDDNPPCFAPPVLRIPGAGTNGGALIIHQTPTILSYLTPKIGMVPEDDAGAYHTLQIALTALDMNNEIHDTHHPVAVAQVSIQIVWQARLRNAVL
jgi:glutathione S-transferase